MTQVFVVVVIDVHGCTKKKCIKKFYQMEKLKTCGISNINFDDKYYKEIHLRPTFYLSIFVFSTFNEASE